MPLPLCKYLLTSLKFSCICGKILLSVCVCFGLRPSVMLSQPIRALMNTSGPLTAFVVKGRLGLSSGLYQTWLCLSLGSSPTGEAAAFSLLWADLLFRRVPQLSVGSHNTRFAAAFL